MNVLENVTYNDAGDEANFCCVGLNSAWLHRHTGTDSRPSQPTSLPPSVYIIAHTPLSCQLLAVQAVCCALVVQALTLHAAWFESRAWFLQHCFCRAGCLKYSVCQALSASMLVYCLGRLARQVTFVSLQPRYLQGSSAQRSLLHVGEAFCVRYGGFSASRMARAHSGVEPLVAMLPCE